ncbi:hypothetical protein BWI97_14275 [Siphonobacter sp. BAB-5405]|uniref:hypothetical protein n=1 Tax=Siphonobacter sp. BAB-5405 TaxID=1864825 RepID=UPI000C808CE8|nr:hypothetical protein [Siphonobacter sp. BAB-5405]PMD95518.1 hypothetical protein BWI97_14275 [Siphonobacter sp. BAB-5405]
MPLPTSVTLHKSAGRLADGDEVMTLAVPEIDNKKRFEKMIFRVMPSGKPVLVLRIAPDDGTGKAGAFGPEHIKQNEYWRNYVDWANFDAKDLVRKLVESNIFASGAELTGQYQPNSPFPSFPTSQATDYVINAEGTITKDPKPASGNDMKEGQDKQNNLLDNIAKNLANGGKTTATGGTGTTTTTQKIVRFVLIGLGVGALIWAGTKLLGKKKK